MKKDFNFSPTHIFLKLGIGAIMQNSVLYTPHKYVSTHNRVTLIRTQLSTHTTNAEE